jgi:alginate O-acetyltransferase complex protein AlgI
MLFSSATFLFYFFPAFLLLYYALPWKNTVLLLASLIFYAWGEPRFVLVLLATSVLNYGVGYFLAKSKQNAAAGNAAASARRSDWLLGLGITANLCLLVYFKYLAFFCSTLNQLLAGISKPLPLPEVVLPLGISFFTFQGISYLIDVYRGVVNAQNSFWRFFMYKAMFPQLIAGPIVRYQQIAMDIDHRSLSNERIWRGLRQFILGLAQKILIANTVALAADQLFAVNPQQLSTPTAWLAIICYTLQILYDFAGYSNMAIGIGQMIGFNYPPNFNHPYTALSITDFWRRWHISLSSWFRDYLYIPLGGNRASPLRTYFNLALVFVLCGLWHGAAWTFLIWGGWHGLLLVIERSGFGRLLARLPSVVAQAWTMLCVMIGWVFFRAADLPYALSFLQTLAGLNHADPLFHPWQMDIQSAQWTAIVVGCVLALWRNPPAWRPVPLQALASALGLLLCAASLAAGTYNPFIYFHF